MNKVFIEGRLGRNAELKETVNGKKFVRFTVAVNWKKGKDDRTTWYDVTSFNPSYTGNLVQYLKSGSPVIVVGDLEPEMNVGKDGKMYMNLSVRANSIEFPKLASKKDDSYNNSQAESTSASTSVPSSVAKNTKNDIPDDDIPMGNIPSNNASETPLVNLPPNDDDDDDLPF